MRMLPTEQVVSCDCSFASSHHQQQQRGTVCVSSYPLAFDATLPLPIIICSTAHLVSTAQLGRTFEDPCLPVSGVLLCQQSYVTMY